MRSEFPLFRIRFLAGFIVALGLGFWLWPVLLREKTYQPIAFNHELHNEVGIECIDCHTGVMSSPTAGLPPNSACQICHEEALGTSSEEQHLLEYLKSGEPIPWQSLFRQPSHVFYSHQRHVVSAGLECSTCHADMGERQAPPTRAPTKLTMGRCLDCHATAGVRNDCTVCHR